MICSHALEPLYSDEIVSTGLSAEPAPARQLSVKPFQPNLNFLSTTWTPISTAARLPFGGDCIYPSRGLRRGVFREVSGQAPRPEIIQEGKLCAAIYCRGCMIGLLRLPAMDRNRA